MVFFLSILPESSLAKPQIRRQMLVLTQNSNVENIEEALQSKGFAFELLAFEGLEHHYGSVYTCKLFEDPSQKVSRKLVEPIFKACYES